MSTELAKRETLISNIGFFEIKLEKDITSVASLHRYSMQSLQRLHDNLSAQYTHTDEYIKLQKPAKFIYDKIVAELKANKQGLESGKGNAMSYTQRFNFLIDVSELFGDELRDAGYEPALKELFENS